MFAPVTGRGGSALRPRQGRRAHGTRGIRRKSARVELQAGQREQVFDAELVRDDGLDHRQVRERLVEPAVRAPQPLVHVDQHFLGRAPRRFVRPHLARLLAQPVEQRGVLAVAVCHGSTLAGSIAQCTQPCSRAHAPSGRRVGAAAHPVTRHVTSGPRLAGRMGRARRRRVRSLVGDGVGWVSGGRFHCGRHSSSQSTGGRVKLDPCHARTPQRGAGPARSRRTGVPAFVHANAGPTHPASGRCRAQCASRRVAPPIS